ncbi:hypothetical protein PHYSODRAFT_329332 [Phytophthora sojae]|uniref:Uncharacterized protein n=1 Tax=Phytophthora sojae (strain P6497) TaxID=1094619 RepID=G4Z239_PHYSP|nr:hypothetical protein PHYSODRAFT_329332 [Phytophthora sojae]EGZ21374.1 hypothetical protein PHYSODRAFT_329332 [Phytophthora sojae]|eukprot:XP_009524091.1 hypothetical protein PHYSODRAFT_329332 [Phytophthora sojae]
MPSREFPAPPDLSELLKFFESDEGKARVSRQNVATRASTQRSRSQSSQSRRLSSGSLNAAASKVWLSPPQTKSTTAGTRRLSQPRAARSENKPAADEKPSTTPQGWNASTLLPPAPAKSLRHQLLCRTYQPPAPVFVVPSEASELLDRLAKGTISSRSKLKPQADLKKCSVGGDDRSSSGVRPAAPTDTRGRDAIQTLLFYRKEVEKRRRLDTNESRADE